MTNYSVIHLKSKKINNKNKMKIYEKITKILKHK